MVIRNMVMADAAKHFFHLQKNANGRNVWPLLQESLAVFAPKRGEFYRGNTKKLQESLAVMT